MTVMTPEFKSFKAFAAAMPPDETYDPYAQHCALAQWVKAEYGDAFVHAGFYSFGIRDPKNGFVRNVQLFESDIGHGQRDDIIKILCHSPTWGVLSAALENRWPS